MSLIKEACDAGARRHLAADLLGLTIRTIQRWTRNGLKDQRKGSRAVPGNKLSPSEKSKIIEVLTSSEFGAANPHQIVPRLADKGVYLGSESTMYRVLREEGMNRHRQSSRTATRKPPETFTATTPRQVWSWDITYCANQCKGAFLQSLHDDGRL
ncbi:MAG: helix-turn-helix domain-containing protein [Desulfobacterium sp.]|nr:helix-turn-helix domain-containing protein [Desulfobacterium sp.]